MLDPDEINRLGVRRRRPNRQRQRRCGAEWRAPGYRIAACPTLIVCAAAYCPETNVLIALDHQGLDAQTPAAKAIPVRLERSPQQDRGSAISTA